MRSGKTSVPQPRTANSKSRPGRRVTGWKSSANFCHPIAKPQPEATGDQRGNESSAEEFPQAGSIPGELDFVPKISSPRPHSLLVAPMSVRGEKPVVSRGGEQERGEVPLC